MGTRADFYKGRGEEAEWLGSIAWDGYPEGVPSNVVKAATEKEFDEAVNELKKRKDWTSPEEGWPWPWNDSHTTDYAYAWDGKVYAGGFGGHWHDTKNEVDEDKWEKLEPAIYPNMKERKNVQFGEKSGTIILSAKIDK